MRRRTLLGLGLTLALPMPKSWALGRIPMGGTLSMQVPHDTSTLDPHELSDPMAALLGASVFEPVYRLDPSGNPYPSLAEGLPQRQGRQTQIVLREGLRSSRGRPLDGFDLVHSIERARQRGAAALLSQVPKAQVVRSSPRTASFADTDPVMLAQALSSPLVALTARSSSPGQPDGTGAFRAEPGSDRLLLMRNKHAARGASYLEEVIVRRASDLASPLRTFEAGQVDIGWLGAGLHQPRAKSIPFDFGSAAWVVLRTGPEATSWNTPGLAQRLIDGIPPARLAHLALGPMPEASRTQPWGGAPCPLYVSAGSAHLVEVARALASILSSPGHEITLTPVPRAELSRRRARGGYGLMVDVVRPLGPPGLATLLALASADDRGQALAIVRNPPRLQSFAPRLLTRSLRLGVVGELRVVGATVPGVQLAALSDGPGWDLGSSYRVHLVG